MTTVSLDWDQIELSKDRAAWREPPREGSPFLPTNWVDLEQVRGTTATTRQENCRKEGPEKSAARLQEVVLRQAQVVRAGWKKIWAVDIMESCVPFFCIGNRRYEKRLHIFLFSISFLGISPKKMPQLVAKHVCWLQPPEENIGKKTTAAVWAHSARRCSPRLTAAMALLRAAARMASTATTRVTGTAKMPKSLVMARTLAGWFLVDLVEVDQIWWVTVLSQMYNKYIYLYYI